MSSRHEDRLGWPGLAGEIFGLAALILVCLVVAFPGVFLRGEMISPASMLCDIAPWSAYAPEGWRGSPDGVFWDMLNQGRPWYLLARQTLDAGEWPLWNHLWPFGMPLLANGQSSVFYPGRLLHAFLDIDLAMTLHVLLKLASCGVAAYFCGRGLRLSRWASRFMCIAWMLCSYNQTYCEWPLINASAWFPLMFLSTEYLLENRLRRGFWLLMVSCTLSVLAGHPETTFVGGVGLAGYVLLRFIMSSNVRARVWKTSALFLLPWMLSGLVAAVQLVPLLEYIANGSFLLLDLQETVRRPLTLAMAPLFWVQRFCGTYQEGTFWGDFNSVISNELYPGVAVMLSCGLLLCRSPRRGLQQRRVWALAIAAGATLLLAFDVPVVSLVTRLPLFDKILLHHFVVFALFALTVLASIGLERWLAQPRRLRELGWCLPPAAVGVLMTGVTYRAYIAHIQYNGRELYIGYQVLTSLAFAIATLVILALHAWRVKRNVVAALLTVLLAADLFYANRDINHTLPKERIVPDTRLTRFLQGLPERGVVDALDTKLPPGFMSSYGLRFTGTIDSIMPVRMVELLNALQSRGVEAGPPACSTVLRDPKQATTLPERYRNFTYVTTLDGIEVYRNPKALPRVLLAGQVKRIATAQDMAERFCTLSGDEILSTIFTDQPPAGPLPDSTAPPVGEARILSETSTHVELEANVTTPAALMLSDCYFPGWYATVDGAAAEIFPADYMFRGILLSPGSHHVEFKYAPKSFFIGMMISLASVVVLILIALSRFRPSSAR